MTPPPDIDLIEEQSTPNSQKAITTSPTNNTGQNWTRRLDTFIRKEVTELRHFFAKPVRRFSSKSNFRDRCKRLGLLAGIGLTFNLIYIMSIGLALSSWTSIKNVLEFNSVGAIFLILVFAPLIEELIFRAGLRNLQYSLFVGPALITLFFGQWQIAAGMFFFTMSIAAYLHFFGLSRQKKQYAGDEFRLGRQFIQHYPKIFWLYAGAFAIVHITNFRFNDASGLLVIFAVIPQLSMGALWGYARLRDGLSASIALHCLNNLIILSLAFGLDS
nr:CPBP family glutamic-type intramembrane protease [uncultured Undibacterium sp.]